MPPDRRTLREIRSAYQGMTLYGMNKVRIIPWMPTTLQNIANAANRVSRVRMPKKSTDLAYLAGILDGEGSIVLRKNAQGRQYVVVAIYNNDRGLIDWLAEIGGYLTTVQPRGISKAVGYMWKIQSNQDVLPFLQALLPYMRIKRQKAEGAINIAAEWLAEIDRKKEENDQRTAIILSLHAEEENPYRISKLVGCSRQTVVRTLEREGVLCAS